MINAHDFLKTAENKFNNCYIYKMGTFKGMEEKMEMVCPAHGTFKQTPKSHLKSKFGCPLCANIKKKKKAVSTANSRIGAETTTKAGFHVVCVEYRRSDDITVLFDDGTRVKTTWGYFKNGSINHPQHKNYRKPSAKQYIGQKSYSTYGELMTVVAARKAEDIDVMFPDGSVVTHARMSTFRSGGIKRPTQTADDIFLYRRNHRLGEKKIQKNGLMATIVEYYKTYIVVEFENGRKRRGTYSQFLRGLMTPSERHNAHDLSRVGERRMLSDGHIIEIVEYKNSQHITISIDGDNTRLKPTNYRWFQTAKYIDAHSQWQHIGKTLTAKTRNNKIGSIGYNVYTHEKMEVIDYVKGGKMTVKFEDGTIVKGVRNYYFKRGLVMNPNCPNRNQVSLNEYAILYCLRDYGFIHAKRGSLKKLGLGMKEIDIFNPEHKIGIEYDGRMHKKAKDIAKNAVCKEAGITLYRIQEPLAPVLDIPNCYRLSDDKALSNNLLNTLNKIIADINSTTTLRISHIKKLDKERIRDEFYNYTYTANNIVGVSRRLKNNDVIMVVKYHGTNDIDFSLSNGKIIKHKTLQMFYEYAWVNQIDYNKAYWEGQTKIAGDWKFTLITYYANDRLLVRRSDGFEQMVTKRAWERGRLFCEKTLIIGPNGGIVKDRTGETGVSTIGLGMTITECFSCNNMTVTFSDGRVAHNVNYQRFCSGYVTPDGTNIVTEKHRLQRIGEKHQSKCGKVYTVIDYVSSAKTIVQDEDGNIKTCAYSDLLRGRVA